METADDNTGLRVASFAYYLDSAKDNYKSKSNSKPPLNVTGFSSSRDSQDSHTNPRVDSFSYRNTSENFVFKVPGPVQDPTTSFSFCQEIPKDGEISVFGADRYFNMKLEHQAGSPKLDFKNKMMTDIPFLGPNARLRTPSLCSEASSWNSKGALFQSLPRVEAKQKKTLGRRIFARFGCPGPCFHRKDVFINQMVADGAAYYGSKPTRTGSERVDTLAFIPPPPNLVTQDTSAAKKQLQILEESRRSIEVFGSGSAASLKGDVATHMERKLSMLTWDAIPKGAAGQNHRSASSTVIGHSTFCDDMASDASSDLFEIENISGSIYLPQTTDHDQMSSCMSPISHYAPSEASIQWSVVTASAADFSSVLSFNDERCVDVVEDVLAKNIASSTGSSKTRGCEPKTRSGGGGILRCKNYKAVEVAEDACLQILFAIHRECYSRYSSTDEAVFINDK
ncbi:protein PHYTOCHROME KINASE SUBSTRATE 3-like isoform X2 [Henckelia pumila]|uniref:protein PHYTOCHROME KINASE SUBSTRATE 3-like isoform X2 n=1 Tax=Henckelia pumila TaxID=405737 RepID=UPI003C6DFFEA